MDKFSFLQSAIQDTQQTIRAIDFKIGALLAGSIVPFPKIREIFPARKGALLRPHRDRPLRCH